MLDIAAYPDLRRNPDRAAFLEDCRFMVLASVKLREAQSFLHMWHGAGLLTEEQTAVMFMTLNEREAREAMGEVR